MDLDPGDLAKVPLPDDVVDAISLWKRIGSHEARRRQLQFLGKLMRRVDIEPISAALDEIDGHSARARFSFHQLESWRDRLLADPSALTEYLRDHPQADRQQLRHQLARIQRTRDDAQQKTEVRALFQLLKSFQTLDGDD